jgi:ribonuclease E
MANKMLIDATHPEETRVVVVRENRVEEFDYESAAKKQLRGNIYLAKVTRVEPSLQAAFVNYGGNRHGFLPFNEIHPDYYHLPLAERQALKQEEQRASRAAQARHQRDDRKGGKGGRDRRRHDDAAAAEAEGDEVEAEGAETEIIIAETVAANEVPAELTGEADPAEASISLQAALPATRYSGDLYAPSDNGADEEEEAPQGDAGNVEDVQYDGENGEYGATDLSDESGEDDEDEDEEDDVVEVINDDGEGAPAPERKASAEDRVPGTVESIGSEDALEELPDRIRRRRRNYKIQEVIKRGQILLVQVVKEERGNKGAALTTYLSLAGRYTVLMPNTGSGGGISRKISSPADRKRLREIAGELDVQEGMGLIIRTAGASRTKSEIKRDYEYLLRLWENVRDLTLKSSAPCLVYEEGDLIKRSIRDLYNKDIDEILVAGEDAYRDAKDFMRMLMPSHAKNVQLYKDPEPLFIRYEVERQLNAMFSPQVTLPSGGYIVLNQTEALVAIDVNSGKSTREFSIEETALKTNLEASEEISRQLRLRDLAGLIVVDFIDMEEKRNNRSVERKLKDCLRNDRARIQVGRISHFGLLEMSRQRLRTGMIEGSTCACPTCQGTGFVRSTESVALSVLRGLEDWLRTNQPCNLNAVTGSEVALYILNQKRGYLRDIEHRYGVTLSISANDRVHGGSFLLEKLSPAVAPPAANNVSMAVRQTDWVDEPEEVEEETAEAPVAAREAESEGEGEGEGGEGRRSSRRRRRRRRGGRGEPGAERSEALNGVAPPWEARGESADAEDAGDDESEDDGEEGDAQRSPQQLDGEDGNGNRRRSRRRGRRGGRHQRARQGREDAAPGENGEVQAGVPAPDAPAEMAPQQPQPEADMAEGAAAEPSRSEPVREEQPEPASAPVASQEPEPAAETRRPEPEPALAAPEPQAAEAKESRGYLNGNGAAHEESEKAEATAAVEETEIEATVVAPPKPRGPKRGWWQRRDPE